ncbi:MAG: hypothetical protein K6F23_11355 [Solobacterium sp.]|nr:hypothetical protein [Solobacterium sp.]
MKLTLKKVILLLLLAVLAGFSVFIAANRPYRWLLIYSLRDMTHPETFPENTNTLSVEEMRSDYRLEYANAADPIPLRSFIGNTQNIHPKVLYIEEGFGGHQFWMAYTPYPWYIDRFENPCIAYSDDGYTWKNIGGNPVDDPKGSGYDSDTHLVYRKDTGLLECWYRYVTDTSKRPVRELICRRTSSDGIRWSDEEVMIDNSTGDYVEFVSPALIWDTDHYDIWVIQIVEDRNIMVRYRMNEDKTIQRIGEISLKYISDTGEAFKPWHIDVIRDDEQYIFLIMCKQLEGKKQWPLFITDTVDLENYSSPVMVLHGSENGWDHDIYRSSIVKVKDEYRIYYSAMSAGGKHGTGITVSDHPGDFIGVRSYTGE